MKQKKFLVFGAGYLGLRVAQRWLDAGAEVRVVTRNASRARRLRDAGFQATVADVTNPSSLTSVIGLNATVLFAVGFDRTSAHTIEQVYVDGLRNVLAALSESTPRFVYISSTGVYGPAGDQWLDEYSPCRPTRAGGKACWAAEQLLQSHPVGQQSVILRLAGIYGPRRVPQRDALRSGELTAPPLDSYLNLIHVDDAASCVIAAAEHPDAPAIFNIADGNPVMRCDYYREVLKVLGLDASLLTAIRLRSGESLRGGKRLNNTKMLNGLGVQPIYQDYRAGLAHAISTETE